MRMGSDEVQAPELLALRDGGDRLFLGVSRGRSTIGSFITYDSHCDQIPEGLSLGEQEAGVENERRK